ncbi:MAG: hypothetical protein Q8934_01065 [Bacillota bacterium]|nr:hypothetical protein [Bacillota bacterium]
MIVVNANIGDFNNVYLAKNAPTNNDVLTYDSTQSNGWLNSLLYSKQEMVQVRTSLSCKGGGLKVMALRLMQQRRV